VIGDELFWGHDAFDMALEYLRHPDAFRDPDMQAADTLPVGVTRTLARLDGSQQDVQR
jgi:hypothetical protein